MILNKIDLNVKIWGKLHQELNKTITLKILATINFLVKGHDIPASIYIRFKHSDKLDVTRSTGYLINPKSWNSSKKLPYKHNPDLKNLATDLNRLSNNIITAFNNTCLNDISKEWLQTQIDKHRGVVKLEHEDNEILTFNIQKVIDTANTRENAQGGLGISKSRIGAYKVLKDLIKEFQGSGKYKVKDVDVSFGMEFLNWMLKTKKYSESYSRKKLDDIKSVCRNAQFYNIDISPQLNLIKSGKYKSNKALYLSLSELQVIKETPLISEALINARKWLLLGCLVGQRGGDLLSINKKNFVTRNGLDVLEITQQKTGKKVTIPILEETRILLEDGLPYKISVQKFNEHLKAVCKLADLNELVEGSKYDNKIKRNVSGIYHKYMLISSHICRRSFATNLYGDLPTPLIMQITAHSTEKMFLNYIGKSSYDYAQQIADYYASEEKKKSRKSYLEVVKKINNN